jgi:hypothetical protein
VRWLAEIGRSPYPGATVVPLMRAPEEHAT